ncbi:MAG: D-alanyl-D-alanine carboxypeptidase family protein [Lachnospiraceae bacterium]|nr:D-alanyl-D-alanine carboxypeptidase family protein [Lachnospiraceae bacterium]
MLCKHKGTHMKDKFRRKFDRSNGDMEYLFRTIKPQNNDNKVRKWIMSAVIIVSIIIVFVTLKSMPSGDEVKMVTTQDTTTATVEVVQDIQIQCQNIYDANKEFLALINVDNLLEEGYVFTHHTLNCGLDVDERIYPDLNQMLTDLNAAGLHYKIISAYRDREVQAYVIQNNVNMNMAQGMSEEEAYRVTYETVQPVGASEHETGLCLDIVSETEYMLVERVGEDPVNIWLMEHCHEYGFILRYPLDKADITGISYEPWHFRYVGKEAAQFMYDNNLTLEEFHMLLNE